MTSTKTRTNASTAASKPMHIEVHQRLQPGVGPGPIHVVKKVLQHVEIGSTVKTVRVPVYLDHTLPAGTGALTASDRQAFSREGLSAQEIAQVEAKLPGKKLKSDAHQAAFDAARPARLREKLADRLIAEFKADPALAAAVMAGLGIQRQPGEASAAQAAATEPVLSLSEKVSNLLALIDDVKRDVAAHKAAARANKRFDKDKLAKILNTVGELDWRMCWFAMSDLVDEFVATPFARPKIWASDMELLSQAVARGYKARKREAGGEEPPAETS